MNLWKVMLDTGHSALVSFVVSIDGIETRYLLGRITGQELVLLLFCEANEI